MPFRTPLNLTYHTILNTIRYYTINIIRYDTNDEIFRIAGAFFSPPLVVHPPAVDNQACPHHKGVDSRASAEAWLPTAPRTTTLPRGQPGLPTPQGCGQPRERGSLVAHRTSLLLLIFPPDRQIEGGPAQSAAAVLGEGLPSPGGRGAEPRRAGSPLCSGRRVSAGD